MKQITNISIFKILLVFFAGQLYAAPVLITQEDTTKLITTSSRPITISTNFIISSADLIITDEKHASLKLLKKGFIVIPRKKNFNATVVIVALNGAMYNIEVSGVGKKSVFKLDDPLQIYDTKGKKFEFESGKMDIDARNIIKTVLLEKKLTGFEKSKAFQNITAKQYNLTREERHTGSKYVIDRWSILNTSGKVLYFTEEDFYTNGILAVAIEKNRLQPSERIFLITIINKNTVYEAEKRGR